MAGTPYEETAEKPRLNGLVALVRDAVLSTEMALVAIVLVGGLLRFHGLGWDQPAGAEYPLQMHPDERFLSIVNNGADWPDSVGGYFDTDKSPLNPYNVAEVNAYVYGTFPLFLVKGVATVRGDDPAGVGNSYNASVEWGRRITALTDTLTILLVFGIGALLFGSRVGLLGSAGYAVAVLPAQLAHFFTMDPYVTFFAMATMLLSILAIRAKDPGLYFWLAVGTGITLGLGLASKVTAWPIGLMPVLAIATRLAVRDLSRLSITWRGERSIPGYWASDIAWLCGTLIVGALVFRVAQPYAFATPDFDGGFFGFARGLPSLFELNPVWKDDLFRERDFQSGSTDYPPFVQFADGTPFLTPLKNIVVWGLGPGLAIAGIAGLAWAAILMFRRRDATWLLPLAFAVAVFAFQGPRFVAFMRYFVPLYPVLTIGAAWLFVRLWDATAPSAWRPSIAAPALLRTWTEQISARQARGAVIAVAVLVVATSTWWALAFQNVYIAEHPRIQASEWIYDNVPPGSAISHESWDDSIPYSLPGRPGGQYTFVPLDMYRTDSPEKIADLVYGSPEAGGPSGLDRVDYVAITSNRVRDSVVNLEREYPATIRYYELLLSGELGFELAAQFKVEPSFLGISVDDSSAEEAFSVYDHPEVWIFRKTEAWDPDRAFALLAEAHPERAINLLPGQGQSNGAQLTAAEAATQQAGGTFSDVFDGDGWASNVPWLWWFLWLQMGALATVPWVTWLFRAMPDRGYGLTKVIGFTGVGVLAWMAVAWDVVDYSGTVAWGAIGAFLVGGAIAGYFRRRSLLADARERWRAWLTLEAVFIIAFAFFLLLRAANPDIWHHPQGGEKPMEMAYLTAVARSTELPPYDPWFGGGSLNYYYMGWFLLSVPMRALRLVPEIGFNLGVATYGALGAVTAASTAMNLVGLSAVRRAGSVAGDAIPWRPLLICAALGAVLLVGIGNLDSGHQTIERLQAVNTWGAFRDVPVLGGAVGILGGLWRWLFEGADLPRYDWWRSSRVHFGQFDITEFPYWSLLFADLHPHVMNVPIFGLTIATGAGYVGAAVRRMRAQTLVLAAMLGLLVGLVRAAHTWDFPTALLLMLTAIVAGQFLRPGRPDLRFWEAAGHLALAGAMLVVPWAPFTSHFAVYESGVQRAVETTEPQEFFAHFGLFIVVALFFMAIRYREELRARDGHPGGNVGLLCLAGPWELVSFAAFVAGVAAFTWQFGITVVALSALIILFLANLLWLEWRSPDRDPGRILATGMFLAAFGIAAGVDVVTVKNDIVRMNTVFKFSLQAWHLFALASAYGAWYIGTALWEARGWRPSIRAGQLPWATAATAVIGVLFIASLIFIWSGTRSRQQARFGDTELTLNGWSFFEHGFFHEDAGTPNNPEDDREFRLDEDRPLVEWLRENVEGSPVVAEAVGPLYHWTGRISMLTGLPAVVGWDWHQIQQRWDFGYLVQERHSDTRRFFQDPDTAFAVDYLRKYNVGYVVVGTEERVFGSEQGLAKFDRMDALVKVFEDGEYAIYEVSQERIPPLVANW